MSSPEILPNQNAERWPRSKYACMYVQGQKECDSGSWLKFMKDVMHWNLPLWTYTPEFGALKSAKKLLLLSSLLSLLLSANSLSLTSCSPAALTCNASPFVLIRILHFLFDLILLDPRTACEMCFAQSKNISFFLFFSWYLLPSLDQTTH